MYHNYRYQAICRLPNGVRQTFTGILTNLKSREEAIAILKRQYINLIDCNVWEV